MKKNLIYFCSILSALLVLFSFNNFSFAQSEQPVLPSGNWQEIDVGPAESYKYEFNTDTIKYDRNSDGSINKNIIVYDEKKTNVVSVSAEFNYYSITKCKINIDAQSISFGEESFYTRKDKFRWTNTPLYLTWITVKPETIGGIRFIALVEYAKSHDEELVSRS